MSLPVHLILSPGTRIVTRNDANRIGGLEVRDETVQQEMVVPPDTSSGLRPPSPQSGEGAGALEMDIVSHDVKKFFGLLLKKNGYVR